MPAFSRASGQGGLVITRKQGQRIVINRGEVILEVVEIKGKQVRLAFVASKEIHIRREEAKELAMLEPDPKNS